jgi:hypothetical protein
MRTKGMPTRMVSQRATHPREWRWCAVRTATAGAEGVCDRPAIADHSFPTPLRGVGPSPLPASRSTMGGNSLARTISDQRRWHRRQLCLGSCHTMAKRSGWSRHTSHTVGGGWLCQRARLRRSMLACRQRHAPSIAVTRLDHAGRWATCAPWDCVQRRSRSHRGRSSSTEWTATNLKRPSGSSSASGAPDATAPAPVISPSFPSAGYLVSSIDTWLGLALLTARPGPGRRLPRAHRSHSARAAPTTKEVVVAVAGVAGAAAKVGWRPRRRNVQQSRPGKQPSGRYGTFSNIHTDHTCCNVYMSPGKATAANRYCTCEGSCRYNPPSARRSRLQSSVGSSQQRTCTCCAHVAIFLHCAAF